MTWFRPLFAGLLVALATPWATEAHTQEDAAPSAFDASAAIAHSQAAIGREVGDYSFVEQDGEAVRLAAFRGKPLVVNLVFTACAESCPVVVQTLYRATEVAQAALGADSFSVLTIGFDTVSDTPERMRAYAHSQGVDLPNWWFLSGDHETVDRLVQDLGFIYFPSPRGFDHLAQTSVIDAEGLVYQQVYGSNFEPPALVEPLKQLAFERQHVEALGHLWVFRSERHLPYC